MDPVGEDKLAGQPHMLQPEALLKEYSGQQFGIKNKYNSQDPRLKHISYTYFHGKSVLDIGCGQGNLALQIALRYMPQSILGIDLSSYLINHANTLVARCVDNNTKKPQLPVDIRKLTNNISQIKVGREQLLSIVHILPDSIIYRQETQKKKDLFTMRKIDLQFQTSHLKPTVNKFPDNLQYQTMNFFNLDQTCRFRTVMCMSVAKCIHLTFGDSVIRSFFQKMHSHIEPGGFLIFEAQEWKSYKTDCKGNQINSRNFQQMVLKPKDYPAFLDELGFKLVQKVDRKQCPTLKKDIYIFARL